MSYKSFIQNSYGDEIYKITKNLQELKKKAAVTKNQVTFLDRCLFHNIIPKSFKTRPSLNTRKGWNITKEYNLKMLKTTRNSVKEKYTKILHNTTIIVEKLRDIMTITDLDNLMKVTETGREKIFIKERARLKEKFEQLTSNELTIIDVNHQSNQRRTNHMKSAVLNLAKDAVEPHINDLLNMGPKFVPTPTKAPIMDIVTSAESAAIHLDAISKHHESESLRNQVSNTLMKFINKKLPSNLTRTQRNALKELRKKNNTTVIYPFDKGAGFAVLDKQDALSKMEEQLGVATKIDIDPTKALLSKFQRTLLKLKKEGKFTANEYREIYPSDAIPPRMYGMIKAHKPGKGFPMRAVVSTVGTAPHGVSRMLVKIIQPILSKNSTQVKNTTTFACEAKTWHIENDEVQVSYDVVALYPSIPISKAIDALMGILQEHAETVKSQTKLKLEDIRTLIQLCLSKSYFLYNDSIFCIDDAGPIGLSLMVVMAEAYLQVLEAQAMKTANNEDVAPKTFKRYVDDSHARFKDLAQAHKFLAILNNQDAKIQYTMDVEDSKKTLAFLDVKLTNNESGTYSCEVYRKDAITNVQAKPHSSVNPTIFEGVFKGFLVRAHRLSSPEHIADEISFLIDIFVENGHPRATLEHISQTFVIPEERIRDATSDVERTKGDKPPTTSTVVIPWIPQLGPKLRRIFKKHNVKVVFKSAPNLKSLLCNNKSKLPPNSHPGIYKLDCTCGASYIGESKKKISSRLEEHQKDIEKRKWSSGCSEHRRDCSGTFEWTSDVTIAIQNDDRLRKVREALEIKRLKTGPDQPLGLNRDTGTISNSNSWNALFRKM